MNSPSIALSACIVCLSACSNDGNIAASLSSEAQEDRQGQDSTATSHALVAPLLDVSGAPETLVLNWQTTQPDQIANVYEFNALSGEELLIRGGIAANQQSLSLPSRTALREWQADRFRVELCVASDCVSSERVAVDSLAEATIQSLAPSVFLKGERFAESVVANYDASVVATSLPVSGSIQVHFRVDKQWFSNKPVDVIDDEFQNLVNVTISDNGDTMAVLMDNTLENEALHRVRIVERLGERWVPTTSFTSSVNGHQNASVAFDLSADGDSILLGTDTSLTIYRQKDSWSQQSVLTPQDTGRFLAASMNDDFTTLFAIEKHAEMLWLVSYQLVMTETGLDAGWVETHRSTIQGINSSDSVLLQASADATSLIIAGWEQAALDERIPTLWRYRVHSGAELSISAEDSVQLMPVAQSDAALRFSASDTLDTVVLGWQSKSGNSAVLNTFKYNDLQRQWRGALELPADIPALTEQGFAGDVRFSGDGTTLLLAVPANRTAPPYISVGELLAIR